MGYSDIGCFGGEIETPHLDGLAKSGVRFTQMYNSARCCPSRASLLTGLHPHQAGIGHMVMDLGHPSYQGYLNERCVTIAEALGESGYSTALSGKWHVGGRYSIRPEEWRSGDVDHPLPHQRGFERWYGTLGGAGSYFFPHTLMRDGELLTLDPDEPFYYTDTISDEAVAAIGDLAARPQPFFLFVSYTAPHWPLQAPRDDIERYRGRYAAGWDVARTERHERMKGMGLLDPSWPISLRDPAAPPWPDIAYRDWEDSRMAVYAAQVDRMDQGVGRIIRSLRDLDIEENTLVLFLSDNGGCAELLREDGDPGSAVPTTRDGRPVRIGNTLESGPGGDDTVMSYDVPWANVSNTPFRLYKHWVHEGGISTPLIARWPARIPARGIVHDPCHMIDLMATCLDAARATYPTEHHGHRIHPLEGESLLPASLGQDLTRDQPLCWEHEGNRAVRSEQWKLVSRHPGRWELYDMLTDRTELRDLADRYAQVVRDLATIYGAWAQRCGVLAWEEVWRRFNPATAARMASYMKVHGDISSRRGT